MSMIEVAQATVTIIPNMKGAQAKISEQMGAAGQSGSKAYGDAFGGNLGSSLNGSGGIMSKILGDRAGTEGVNGAAKFGSGFIGKLGSSLGGVAGVMSGALGAAGIAAATKAFYGIGETFDEMTDKIIIGTGASGAALDGLTESAKNIATAAPTSFGEAGNIVQDLNTRLGLTGGTLEQVGTQIAQVGQMTGEAFNIEAFSGAMSAWGTSTADMSGQLDTLFAVSQSTGIGMNQLTSIMETTAPQMQTLGYSFSDTAAMAGLLDKAGLDAGTTMNRMSMGLAKIAKDGEQPAAAMQRVTQEISAYIEKGDKAAAISTASELFGTRGATQFVAAVQSGALSVDDFGAAMSDSAGIINDTETKTRDFSENVQILKNQFSKLLEPIGSAVFTGLSSVVAGISSAFQAFVSGPGQVVKQVFSAIVGIIKQFAAAFASAFKNSSGMSSLSKGASSLGSAFKAVGKALSPVFSVLFKLLKTVVPPLARIVGGVLGTAFRALTAPIRAIIKIFSKFGSKVKDIKDKVADFIAKVKAPFNFLSGIKLPHIHVSGKFPFGIAGKGEKPKFSIDWAAEGGIVSGATLIGAGEAGKEAIIPLERNTDWADIIADKVNSGNTYNITLNANGQENPEAFAQRFARELRKQVRMGTV